MPQTNAVPTTATMGSQISPSGSTGPISRGIEAELVAMQDPSSTGKRRSMFRSGVGTASTPDLKAKEIRPHSTMAPGSRSHDRPPSSSAIRRVELPLSTMPSVGSTEILASTSCQPSISSSPSIPPQQSPSLSTVPGPLQRNRASSHGAALREGPRPSLDYKDRETARMMEQQRGGMTQGTSNVSGSSKSGVFPEGHMSVGKRTRGMFGRFFSGGAKEPTVSTSGSQRPTSQSRPSILSTAPSSRSPPPPPVPALPIEYKRSRERAPSSAGATALASAAPRRSVDTSHTRPNDASPIPPPIPAVNQTPDENPQKFFAPELEVVGRTHTQPEPGTETASASDVTASDVTVTTRRTSRHIREAGTHAEMDSEMAPVEPEADVIPMESGPLPSSATDTTPQRNLRKWTRDIEGILDGDGADDNLAMGLGLPSTSMRVREGTSSPRLLVDLPGDASPVNNPTSRNGSGSRHTKPPPVNPRTSSVVRLPEDLEERNWPMNQEGDLDTKSDGVLPLGRIAAPEPSGSRVSSASTPPHLTNSGDTAGQESAEVVLDLPVIAGVDSPIVNGGEPMQRERTTTTGDSETITSPKTPIGSVFADAVLHSSPARSLSLNGSERARNGSLMSHEDLEKQGQALAAEILRGDVTHIAKDRVAEYLGGTKPTSRFALRYYMQDFDFAGMRLDEAFRFFCSKLYLKAETQEIDRILEGFSDRYVECNSNTIFVSPTVVHVVTGSFLLLNTDLHIADIPNHMSRTQFTRLTLETIYANVAPAQPSMKSSTPDLIRDDSYSSLRQSTGSPTLNASSSQISSIATPSRGPPGRSASVYSSGSGSGNVGLGLPGSSAEMSGMQEAKIRLGSNTSLGSNHLYTKGWESDVESALREIYNAVRSSQILLPVGSPVPKLPQGSPYGGKRNMSGMSNMSSRPGSNSSSADRLGAHKRGSIRGMGNLLSTSPYGDGRTSPTPSFATSIGENYQHQYLAPPSLGFASNLSHTVIKEQEDEVASVGSLASDSTVEDLSDDELALLGAPWAKEGNLQRKPYWEGPHKRSKDKSWKGVFAVIQRGDLHMFTFGEGSSSMSGVGVGGGNWMQNARDRGEMNLSHSLASALPPPGYNASRPYCFSLTLPNGEMSFFQAGTEDLVQEWVQTCNYWAARRSRPPLPGGVSNLEYGWRSLEDSNEPDELETRSIMSNRSGRSRMSFQHTIGRRGIGSGGGMGGGMGGGGMGSDRLHISEWKAPQASLIPSSLEEEAQMESLQRHIVGLIKELDRHKSLEEPLSKLFPPRSTSLMKARENWKTKSFFIHSEIVKYEVYVDCLKSAISLQLRKQGEKKLERSLQRGVGRVDQDGRGEVDEDEDDGKMSPALLGEMRVTPVPPGEDD